jgi:HEAT repeat protein
MGTQQQMGEIVNEIYFVQPKDFAIFAELWDSRNIPLLRQALLSSNYMLVHYSAAALARMGDRMAAPQIEAACKRLPADEARFVAYALFWFEDPALDAVAKQLSSMSQVEKPLV